MSGDNIKFTKQPKNNIWRFLNDQATTSEFFEKAYDIERDVEKLAKTIKCEIVLPLPNELQIDIDCEDQYTFFQGRINDLGHWIEIEKIKETPSKSGLPNRHITVTLTKEISDAERIAFQFMLGSDLIRESLNALRLYENIFPNVLFFKPLSRKQT